MLYVRKDLLSITEGYLLHQTNCKGALGAGVALAIRRKYPLVYVQYMKMCGSFPARELLGMCQIVPVTTTLNIVNIFGQFDYGRMPGQIYTDYNAVETAFISLSESIPKDSHIFLPKNMGCGLAGGDWEKYSEIIDRYFPYAVACYL
jgi:O-acetyl-ADP-ribose deacetylase (regulator of RNase III)